MGRLDGKIALITGAGTGMGRATMEVFAREGAKVAGCSRTQSDLDETKKLVEDAGGEAFVMVADVSKSTACKNFIAASVEHFGGLDILVNNAGVGWDYEKKRPGTMNVVDETTDEAWSEVMAINLDSAFYMSRDCIPHLRARGGGTIINNASMGGLFGLKSAHAYTAAKAGMINLTRSMAVTYGPENIRTNCLCPGATDTRMLTPFNEAFDNPFENDDVRFTLSPLGRPATPEEIALALLFFAAEGSYCNGATLLLDGGTTAGVL